MTALRTNTARLVLDRVSKDDRPQVVEQVAYALDATSGAADIGFAATLLSLQPSDRARSAIIAHVKQLVERGDHALATTACRDHDELNDAVFAAVVEAVSNESTWLQASGRRGIAVPVSIASESRSASALNDDSDDSLKSCVEKVGNSLQFLVRIGMPQQDESNSRTLLETCIVLVGAQDKRLSAAAQELLYHALLEAQSSSTLGKDQLWHRIKSLTGSLDAFYKTVGFSLWLRWSLSANAPGPTVLSQNEYWSLLVDGLGRGDGERRKAALQILRISVQLALQNPSLISMVASGSVRDQSMSEHPSNPSTLNSSLCCPSISNHRNSLSESK